MFCLGNVRKGKTDNVLKKKNPASETEEDWNLEEDDGRSSESDVDKSIQIFLLSLTMITKLMIGFNSIEMKRKKEKKKFSRERHGKEKKKGERKGKGNIGEAREEGSLVHHPGSPIARSPPLSSPPSIHPLSLMATPSTSSSPAASTNFQLVLSDDSESSGYFRFKPASLSKDKKLSMECKVMLKKLPPTNATVFKIQEYQPFDLPSLSRGKTVTGGKARRGGVGGRNPGLKTEDKSRSSNFSHNKVEKLKYADVYSSSD